MTSPIDTEKLIRWYDFQAPLYALWRNRFDAELVKQVTRTVQSAAPFPLLDAGCGTGLFAIAIAAERPDATVLGIDLSAGMLDVARRAAHTRGADNVGFARADVTRLPCHEGQFGAVVAAGLLPNVNRHAAVLAELARVLRVDGELVLVEFDRESMGGASRALFQLMIIGYRAVSFVFRRFRFARDWSLDASTIDRGQLEGWASAAGLALADARACANHTIYRLRRASRR